MRLVPASHPGLENDAEISECGTYRYWLTRENLLPGTTRNHLSLIVLGANPSKATADVDDQTILKEMKFARAWGYGRLVKLNAQAYRATDPDEMWRARRSGVDVVGADNDAHLRAALAMPRSNVMVAWGKNSTPERVADIMALLDEAARDAYCWKVNKDSSPTHPLQSDKATPVLWRASSRSA